MESVVERLFIFQNMVPNWLLQDLKIIFKIFKLCGDITNREFQKQLVDETLKKYGKIDILINNAGIAKYGSLMEVNEDDYDSIMNTNLKAAVFLTQLCVPHLIFQKGSFILKIFAIVYLKPSQNFNWSFLTLKTHQLAPGLILTN